MTKLRRTLWRVAGNSVFNLVEQLNRILPQIEERFSQVDAVGQRPDMKGKSLINLGNLKGVDSIADPATATAEDCANKINEILDGFND